MNERVFQTPKPLTEPEIEEIIEKFGNAALLSKEAGFTGVQMHAAHGYLISQFLSPLFNRRKDSYGGSIQARSRIIVEIIERVRYAVGSAFPIGIKINSSDQLEGGLTQEDAFEVIRILDKTSLDLIEISGGSYFPGATPSSDSSSSGPYFIDFAKKAKRLTHIPLVVTGGFKTREQALDILFSGAVDSVGLGRALILNPNLPQDWLNEKGIAPDFPTFRAPPFGGVTAWYTMLLTALANDNESDFSLDLLSAIHSYEKRDKHRIVKWLAKFQ